MTLANWRDLAVVLLAIEAFFISLIPAAILYLAVRGMLWVIRKLRAVAPIVQGAFRKAATISEQASHRMAAPVIATSAALARVGRVRSAVTTALLARKEV